MTTQTQAKTKWCPFSRTGIYAGDGAVAVNRHCSDDMKGGRLIESQTRCLGADCMAWRWNAEAKLSDMFNRVPGDFDADHMPPVEEQIKTRPKGDGWRIAYCSWDDEDGDGWFVTWERDHDPEREGECGLASKPSIGNFSIGIQGGGGGGKK